MFTAECTVRSSPSPQLQRREVPEPSAVSLKIEETPEEEPEREVKCVTDGLRHQSLSPGPASLDNSIDCCEPETESLDSRCVSLEPEVVSSPCWEESGRRSTQGIPEVERNVKFSQPDTRTGKNQPDNRPEGSGAKNRSKSSTLSLHAVAAAREREEEPTLQRRNSIHNVPFVDVHDPDTRTRMERYKEERRSMLRAKYKAEDYLSSTFARKKKVGSTSSCEGDLSSVSVTANKSISASPPASPSLRKLSTPDCPQSPQSSKISLKKIDLKNTEQLPNSPTLEVETALNSPDAVIYK